MRNSALTFTDTNTKVVLPVAHNVLKYLTVRLSGVNTATQVLLY